MANTFSQIYIHTIFAVKGRNNLIAETWEDELYKYITGIVNYKQQKLLAINGTSDHIHLMLGLDPSCCLSDLVREIKKSSNEFINQKKFTKFNFKWQQGFGAFSHSKSTLEIGIGYIGNQKLHHQKISFKDEYKLILNENEVEYKDEYLFEFE